MFGLSANDKMFSVKADDFDYDTEMAGNDLDHRVRLCYIPSKLVLEKKNLDRIRHGSNKFFYTHTRRNQPFFGSEARIY